MKMTVSQSSTSAFNLAPIATLAAEATDAQPSDLAPTMARRREQNAPTVPVSVSAGGLVT